VPTKKKRVDGKTGAAKTVQSKKRAVDRRKTKRAEAINRGLDKGARKVVSKIPGSSGPSKGAVDWIIKNIPSPTAKKKK